MVVHQSRQTKLVNSKPKVKSGCQTCKQRKVKCDEGRPVCNRCLSSGRTCDGYGIWGGGGNYYHQRYGTNKDSSRGINQSSTIAWPITTVFELADPRERGCFEWFVHRSLPKLPGPLASTFWKTFLLQASSTEPAVLSAILALGSAHENESTPGEKLDPKGEGFTLRQYNKAITQLQPHLSKCASSLSVRVALIVCASLTFLELLRGHYHAASIHLHHGLRLLSTAGYDESLRKNSTDDDQIYVTFKALQVQSNLLGQEVSDIPSTLSSSQFSAVPDRFLNIKQARESLDELVLRIQKFGQGSSHLKLAVEAKQLDLIEAKLKDDLDQWLSQHEALKSRNDPKLNPLELVAHKLLCTHHKMAEIMARTARYTLDESMYDQEITRFFSIINQSIEIHTTVFSLLNSGKHPHHSTDTSGWIADIGWIPPLYYTAIKCRAHRIRLQAIKLFNSRPHKEGIWDSSLTARIAQKIVQIEENGFYEPLHVGDDFDMLKHPREEDLSLPELPLTSRICHLKIDLPEDPRGRIFLSYRRSQDNVTMMSIFDLVSQEWIVDTHDLRLRYSKPTQSAMRHQKVQQPIISSKVRSDQWEMQDRGTAHERTAPNGAELPFSKNYEMMVACVQFM